MAPFGLVNLAAGASEVRARDFLLGSLLGLTPVVCAFALLGDRLARALRDPEPTNLVLFAAVAAGVLALSLLVGRWSGAARR